MWSRLAADLNLSYKTIVNTCGQLRPMGAQTHDGTTTGQFALGVDPISANVRIGSIANRIKEVVN